MVGLTLPPTRNVVILGASYAGEFPLTLLLPRGAKISPPFPRSDPLPSSGARAAELLSRTLPSTHRVVVIDRQR